MHWRGMVSVAVGIGLYLVALAVICMAAATLGIALMGCMLARWWGCGRPTTGGGRRACRGMVVGRGSWER